jgi:hypothetical protein
MTSSTSKNPQVSDLQRFLALKALREYIYLHNPVTNSAADFIEDVPKFRPYGMFFNDMAPSAAIIKSNPVERRKQIADAAQSVSHLHEDHNLSRDMLRGSASMAAASIPTSVILGGATRLMTRGKGGWPKYRGNKTFTNPRMRGKLMTGIGDDVVNGAALGGTVGAAIPFLSHQVNPTPEALDEASKILQESPYLSSLPGADIVASQNYNKDESKPYQAAKATVQNAALGAGVGATANAVTHGASVARTSVEHLFGGKKPYPVFKSGPIGRSSLLGAGIGGGVGLLTSALLPSNY